MTLTPGQRFVLTLNAYLHTRTSYLQGTTATLDEIEMAENGLAQVVDEMLKAASKPSRPEN